MSEQTANLAHVDQAFARLTANVQEAIGVMVDGLDRGVSPVDSVVAFYQGSFRLDRKMATVLFGVALLELAKRERADLCVLEGVCRCACHR